VNAKRVTNDKYPPQESLLFVECSIFSFICLFFTPTMPCKTKKELFMSNSHNNQAFINMLYEKLNEYDIIRMQKA
jgi:hypothetical protein